MQKSLNLLEQSKHHLTSINGQQSRSLHLKVLILLNVLSIKTGDSQYANLQFADLVAFFKSQKDLRKKAFEVKLALKFTLDVGSVANLVQSSPSVDSEQVSTTHIYIGRTTIKNNQYLVIIQSIFSIHDSIVCCIDQITKPCTLYYIPMIEIFF